MYYGVDENGNIVVSESSSILPEQYQDIFPENISEYLSVSSGDFSIVPDIGNSVIEFPDFDYVTYDDLVELLALIPGYNVYPNTAAVSVFDGVFRNMNSDIDYVVMSGSNSSSTFMYYSKDGSCSGNTIHLSAPVTSIAYQSVSSSGSTQYRYSVSTIGDTDFNLSNYLVYTNLVEGYPALPSDSRGVGQSLPYGIISLVAVGIVIASFIFTLHKGLK